MNQVDQSERPERDEVYLRKFLSDVWAARKAALCAVITVTVVYLGFFAFKLFSNPPIFTYSLVIDFVFEEAKKDQYPNKSPFSISDLIAPNFLAEIYTLNGLSRREMPRRKFMHNFRIVPYTPAYKLVAKKYDELLSTRNLRILEFEELLMLEDDMKKEINRLQTRAALLSFRAEWGAISQDAVKNILLSVPQYWANKMVNEYGVLELDVQMYSPVLFDTHQYEDFDYLVALDKIQTNIMLVSYSIAELLTFPNSQRVTDEKTGYTLLDLQKLVQDIVTYDLNRLSSFIQELGISSHKEAVILYYEHQINKLDRDKEYQIEQADLINQALRDYSLQLGNADETRVVRENTVDMVQASGDFLDRITELVKQSEDLEYRQNLYNRYIQYKQESARIDYEIAQKQALLKALGDEQTKRNTLFGHRYEESLMQERFPVILSKMSEYMDILNRLHSKLSKENFGHDTKLYRVANVDAVKTTGIIISSMDKIIFGFLIFGVAFVTVVVKLLMTRSKEKSD